MKTLVRCAIFFIVTSTGWAAKPVDFSEFKGKFSGTYVVTASGTGAGTVTVTARPQRKGKQLNVTLNGVIIASGTQIPVACQLVFKPKKKVVSTAGLLGLFGPVATQPARYSISKRRIQTTLAEVPGSTAGTIPIDSSSVTYTFSFSGKSLTILGSGFLVTGGSPTPITFSFQGR